MKMSTIGARVFALSLCTGALLLGCDGDGKRGASRDASADGELDASTTDEPTEDAGRAVDGASEANPDASSVMGDAGPFPTNASGQVLCGTAPCACSDQTDNDDDGLTDLEDPECVSAWDNDEGSFATGISGDNRDDACQDCFFDGNSGAGDDGCRLPSSCLEDGTASSGRGSCNTCEQSDACRDFCQAFTPNGCDCFGCCGVNVAGTVHHVLVAPGCQIDGDTLEGCTECVPSESCANECGECELCPGKTLADLPASCTQVDAGAPDAGEPGYTCDDGSVRCGDGLPACADTEVCTFGCCVRLPVIR